MMIINPAAGKGRYKKGLTAAIKRLSDAGYDVSVYFTEARGHATQLAAEHGADYEKLICLGGDGTLAEVVAGVMTLQKKPQLGYFPIGTANDIARTLKLPKNDIESGAIRFIQGSPMPFDTGSCDKRFFNYVAAFGAFTEVSYATPQNAKHALGEAAYLIGAVKAIGGVRSRHVRVEYDDGVLDGDFIYGGVSNSFSVGGVVDLPREMIDLSDGLHELIMVKKLPNTAALLKLAAQVFRHNYSSEYIVILQTKKAKFIFDEPTPWTFDGEDGGEHTELSLQNHCRGVEIIR